VHKVVHKVVHKEVTFVKLRSGYAQRNVDENEDLCEFKSKLYLN